jgi:hypothetical protein
MKKKGRGRESGMVSCRPTSMLSLEYPNVYYVDPRHPGATHP